MANTKHTNDNEITLGILDDHQVVLQGLEILPYLNNRLGIIVSETDPAAFMAAVRNTKPAIILLDLLIGAENSLDIIASLRRDIPGLKIIIYTGNSPNHILQLALQSGALFGLDKSLPPQSIISAIIAAYEDTEWPECCITEQSTNNPETLTKREIELLILFAKGLTYKEIAYKLNISYHTVDSHKRNICSKLNIRTTTDIVNYAYAHNLIR